MPEPVEIPPWKQRLRIIAAQYAQRDMRWSHLVLGAMIALGLIVNLVLPHGWTVWPFVLAAALMLTIHELADRNGQGIPPMHVYAFFVAGMTLWLGVVLVLSAVNVLVLLLGIGVLAYFAVQGYLKQREKMRLIAARRAAKLCIHCGHVIDPALAFCEGCGEDPDPDLNRLRRVASAGGHRRRDHLRSVLKPDPPTTSAQKKEQALLARRHRKRGRA